MDEFLEVIISDACHTETPYINMSWEQCGNLQLVLQIKVQLCGPTEKFSCETFTSRLLLSRTFVQKSLRAACSSFSPA